jgi:hypothetical protein
VVVEHLPAARSRTDEVGPPEQQIRPAAVRNPDDLPAVEVLRQPSQRREDVAVVRDPSEVERLDLVAAGEHLRDIPEGRHSVVAAGRDRIQELRRAAHGADVHLAPGLLDERRHPVHAWVVTAGLGVARKGNEIEPTLVGAGRGGRGCREDEREHGE